MRTPQPKNGDTSSAGPPGATTKQKALPRLRSRRARFSALGLVALGISSGVLAASALGAGTPAPPQTSLKVLLIGNGTADTTTGAWEAALTSEGVPYTEVSASNTTTLGSWNVALPALTAGTTGNYNGVVVADNPAYFAPGQLTGLYAYEAQYNVRQVDGSVSGFPSAPPNLGVSNDTTGIAITATAENLTTTPGGGTTAFPGLAGSVPFDTGSFAYPVTPTVGAPFTSWLSYGDTSSLGGVYQHPSTDPQKNVQEAALFFSYNANQQQWHVLSRGLIDWVTQNTHLGLFRNYASLNLDDMFNSDNTWNTTTHETSITAAAQMTPADIVAAAQWSRLNGFRIDWAYNAGASSSTASPPVADPQLAQYQATDPATGKPYSQDFGWINHTWDHATIDSGCATTNYIAAEINQNATFATQAPGTAGLGGLGLTADPTGALNGGYGTFDVHTFVPGEHSGLANLIPGVNGAVDPPSATGSAAGSGTLATGTYQYAVTDQYIATTGGDSIASVTSVPVTAGQGVTLNWTGVCKAAGYRVYRKGPTDTVWSLVASVPPPNPATLDPTSTTNTTGGGMAPVSYTDTGAAGTPQASTWVPPTTTSAPESAYQQNINLIPALTSTLITTVGGDASKPYPNLPDTQFGVNTTTAYTDSTFAAGQSFTDGPAVVVPRHPINIFYNAATWTQQIDEYNWIYQSAPGGNCVATSVTTCSATAATQANISDSVESGMLATITNNDPEPFYAHQTNLVGASTSASVLAPVLTQLVTAYHSTFSAAEPYVQPTLSQAGAILGKKAAWAAALAAGTVTATEQGGTIVIKNTGASLGIPVNAPTGTLIEPAGTAFGSAYAGSLSDWVTIPAGGTYTLQAPAAPYVTTQPANQTVLAGANATFSAVATNGESNPPATVQWDVSTNNGLTWGPVAGATSTTLALNAVTGSMNNNEYEAIFTNSLGSTTSNPAVLLVGHTNPTVTPPTAGTITFGQPLGSSTLSGGTSSVPGTWSFLNPSTALGAGTYTNVPVIFTPNDTASYNVVPSTVTVTVNQATPFVTVVSNPITYGQTLGNTPLLFSASVTRGGAPLRGGSSIIQNARFKPNAGTVTETVTYIPADGADFNIVTTTTRVKVLKAHPKLSATIRTRKPSGGKLVSVLLSGMTRGAKETFVIQNRHGRTQTVLRFSARGGTQTVNIKLIGSHRRGLAKGNYRVVLVQGATGNYLACSSSARKFKIVK